MFDNQQFFTVVGDRLNINKVTKSLFIVDTIDEYLLRRMEQQIHYFER